MGAILTFFHDNENHAPIGETSVARLSPKSLIIIIILFINNNKVVWSDTPDGTHSRFREADRPLGESHAPTTFDHTHRSRWRAVAPTPIKFSYWRMRMNFLSSQ
jgi:hypothetical protein